MSTRRTFLQTVTAAAPLATAMAASREIKFHQPLGLQLYTVRREMAKDVAGTLREVRDFGFKEVEGGIIKGMTAQQVKEALDTAGLHMTGFGTSYEHIDKDVSQVAADAHTLGAEYVSTAWIPHNGNFTPDNAQKAAEVFNRAGKALKAEGLRFCYHVHGYEFQPSPKGTLFDDMMAATEPGIADYEMDVFWIVRPGQDPVKLLEKYPGRFILMHLKDMRKGTETNVLTGQAPDDTNVVIGTGQLDFPAILAAAKKNGVKRYYIEDESAEATQHLQASREYLHRIGL